MPTNNDPDENDEKRGRPLTILPNPEYVRGRCPRCGAPLISSMGYTTTTGYLCRWVCLNALLACLGPEDSCNYEKVL